MADDRFANSKCFIFSPEGYIEITYSELCRRRETDISYQSRRFIPLHGMLMEVTEADYIAFYKEKRRQKYLKERSIENGDISIDILTAEGFNGADMLVDTSEPVDEQIIGRLEEEQLHRCVSLLSEEEQALIRDLFFNDLTERDLASRLGVSQAAINRRKKRILKKLKDFFAQ